MNNNQDVRFLYLRDNTGRVVTVARRLSDDRMSVEFAFSANRPKDSFDENGKLHGPDAFNKRVGRNIALGRLNANKVFSVFMDNGVRPIEAILEHLAYSNNKEIPRCVRDVARFQYENGWTHQNEVLPSEELFNF